MISVGVSSVSRLYMCEERIVFIRCFRVKGWWFRSCGLVVLLLVWLVIRWLVGVGGGVGWWYGGVLVVG